MKKIIPILILLCVVTSIPVFASGEDFLYTSTWYQSVYSNGSYRVTNSSGSSSADITNSTSAYTILGGQLQGGLQDPYPYIYYTVDNNFCTQINTFLPMGLTLAPSQSISLQFIVIYNTGFNTVNPGYTVSFIQNDPNSTFYATTDIITYSSGEVVSINLSTTGNPIGTTTIASGNRADLITVSYTNNSTSSINIDRLNFVIGARSGSSIPGDVIIGNLTSGNTAVMLPSYIEDNLIRIGNDIKTQLSKLNDILSQLDDIEQQLADLNISFTDNSSTQNNFYESTTESLESVESGIDSIVTQTPEQAEKVAELEAKKEEFIEAKDEALEELEGINQEDITGDLDFIITSQESLMGEYAIGIHVINESFQGLLDNSIILTIMTLVLTFSIAGFVLYGER